MPPLKPTTWPIRAFGAILGVLGLLLWWRGGFLSPITYRNVQILLPLHYMFIVFGALTSTLPLIPLYFLSLLLRGKARDQLLDYINRLDSDTTSLQQTTSADEVAVVLRRHIARTNRRFYITLASVVLSILIILPLLAFDFLSRTAFRRYSESLLPLVHAARLDFSSADVYRQFILEGNQVFKGQTPNATATQAIHSILAQLYAEEVRNSADFEIAMQTVYNERIRPLIRPEVRVLQEKALEVPFNPALESEAAKITLLTLLGMLCNEQGNQGTHIAPYLQGRQLLLAAHDLASASKKGLASTHNALGVNYADTLKCYTAYTKTFRVPPKALAIVQAALHETQPSKPLTLARLADQEYEDAVRIGPNNFVTARRLNNRVDLRLSLLFRIHLNNENFEPNDRTDEFFLISNFDPPAFQGPRPDRLARILETLRSDLNAALVLDRDPIIYFTRAQLYSVAGALAEKYHLRHAFWGADKRLRELALADLETAASLHLPTQYLQQSRAREFFLDWLWTSDTQARLTSLSTSQPL